jgi:tight adherence protein C
MRLVAALPDALDLLAVAIAGGRSHRAALAGIAVAVRRPLADELAMVVAEMECGLSQERALRRLRERSPGAEVAALATGLERSRRHGSPLAERLHELAATLRHDGRRRVEERSARAAPKIQLVVALVLVPSVLLLVAAALLAHSGALLGTV